MAARERNRIEMTGGSRRACRTYFLSAENWVGGELFWWWWWWGGERQRRTVGCFALDTTEVPRDDFFKCLKSNTRGEGVEIQGCGLFYGEERVCLHCAVLRVAPSTHVAESKAQAMHWFMAGRTL